MMKNIQKRSRKTLCTLGLAMIFIFGLIAITASGGGGGGSDDSSDGSNGGAGTTYNLTGQWNATWKSISISGPCASGTVTEQGSATIIQTGSTFTLTFGTGFSCRPASVCVFTGGTVSGAEYTIQNAGDTNDGEGGKYQNTINFTATSATKADGVGASIYIHPDAFCEWATVITLNKKEE